MDATPSFRLPQGSETGVPVWPPKPMVIRGQTFTWGRQTYVMGVINVTPDSFSGDGLLVTPYSGGDAAGAALRQATAMAAEGADLLDIGGESSRPGHEPVDVEEELRRTIPIIEAVRAALPGMPISIDTTKSAVARPALEAGADLINDVSAVKSDGSLARLAAECGVPYVVMHNRAEARYTNVLAEVLADLQAGIARALSAGVAWEALIVDPGIGFGKTPEQSLHVLANLGTLRGLGRPVLLGTSRKSTIGKVLDLPVAERLEGTLATTALGVAAGVDIVRVHEVAANRRAARMSDAMLRAGRLGPNGWEPA